VKLEIFIAHLHSLSISDGWKDRQTEERRTPWRHNEDCLTAYLSVA